MNSRNMKLFSRNLILIKSQNLQKPQTLQKFIKNQEIKMQTAQNSGEKDQIEDGVYNVKDVKFDIDPAVLQLKVDEVIQRYFRSY